MKSFRLTVLLFVACAFALAGIAHAQVSREVEAITFSNGTSNFYNKVYSIKKPCLVFFWDSNYFAGKEGQENEWKIFRELAKKYSNSGIMFFSYDQAKERDYKPREGHIGFHGKDVARENINRIPSVAMYKGGRQIDIRRGGAATGFMEANWKNCDLWIRFNLTDEFADEPNTLKYRNTFDIRKVPR